MPFALRTREVPDLSRGVGIIDIGSNSVRLVVYADRGRTPIPIFNEKVLCGLGRTVATTGLLDEDGVDRALAALARFKGLTSALGIEQVDAVATAAAREASNGPGFIERANAICGVPIKILSGQDEARLAAEGVLAGIPDADGIVGDLGGGSLELVHLARGRQGEGTTLPVGPLRLMDLSGGSISKARDILAKIFDEVSWLPDAVSDNFYAVGGNWRNLARLHMTQEDYPLRVLHNYQFSRGDALALAGIIATQSRKSLERVSGISRRRQETLPYAALVLEQALKASGAKRVVISAYGLREGLLFSRLTAAERRQDPLDTWANGIAERMGRFPEHGTELERFTAPLLSTGPQASRSPDDTRLFRAACHLSDMGWRIHPDYRSQHCFFEILRAPVSGIDHPGRIFLALAIANRYRGGVSGEDSDRITALLDQPRADRARALGLALRLGHTISAGAPRLITGFKLDFNAGKACLMVPLSKRDLLGEPVEKRLTALARALGREADIQVVDG